MANLAPLQELYVWMRAEGILYARSGELELRLEVQPAPPVPEDKSITPVDTEARDLDELLGSSNVDPVSFRKAIASLVART